MRCADMQEKLTAFFDGELRETERAAAEEHLRQCAACQREFATLQTTSRLLQAWEAPAVSSHVHTTFMAKLEERAARKPWWSVLFTGWQRQVAWATAAAILVAVALGVKRPTPPPTNERENNRAYVATRSEAEKKDKAGRLARRTPEADVFSANKPASKTAEGKTLSKPQQTRKANKVLIAKAPPAALPVLKPSAAALPHREVHPGLGKDSPTPAPADEAAAMLVASPPPEEAANLVKTLIAEAVEIAPLEVVDVTPVSNVEKRPERLLTDWLTETGD